MSRAAIEVGNLVKTYVSYRRRGFFGREKVLVRALKGVSFEVRKGEVFGLLGPNGAGKTTTVKIISTLLLPDSGTARVLGYDVIEEAAKVRRIIGVSLTVEKGFFWKLTGRENLKYFGMLYGLDGPRLRERVEEVLDLVGLNELGAADKLYEEYSLGMKARLSLARALLTDPPVLILDEPTLGLDPPSARAIREMLVRLAHEEDRTVLMTTHNMFEAEIVCDRVAIINEGRIVAVDTVEGLKQRVSDSISLEVLALTPASIPLKALETSLRSALGAPLTLSGSNGGVRVKVVTPSNEVDDYTSRLLKALHENSCSVLRVKVKRPTLEDVFIKLTKGEGA